MNWDAIGAVGEVLGAVAVVGTLGYLALQIRQNTERERLSQEFVSNKYFNELRVLVASDPELAEIEMKGVSDLSLLTDLERRRFDELTISWIWAIQKFYHQHQSSMVNVGATTGFEEAGLPFMARRFMGAGFLEWWSQMRDEFSADEAFCDVMDALVAQLRRSMDTK